VIRSPLQEYIATAATKIAITVAFTTKDGHESDLVLAGTLNIGPTVVASVETSIVGGTVNVMMDVESDLIASSAYKLIVFMAAKENVNAQKSVARHDLLGILVADVPFCPAMPLLHSIPDNAEENSAPTGRFWVCVTNARDRRSIVQNVPDLCERRQRC